MCLSSPHAIIAHFLDQLREGQLVGQILLQRLYSYWRDTGELYSGQRGTRTHMRSIHSVSSAPLCMCVALEGPWFTWHSVMPASSGYI